MVPTMIILSGGSGCSVKMAFPEPVLLSENFGMTNLAPEQLEKTQAKLL
jgi:hypothetical protein